MQAVRHILWIDESSLAACPLPFRVPTILADALLRDPRKQKSRRSAWQSEVILRSMTDDESCAVIQNPPTARGVVLESKMQLCIDNASSS